ncbi:hypothetical protein ACHAXT_000778 [Thalassiosira profunda]
MATVSIPTTEPPLCPEESATAHDLMPSTFMDENITRELFFAVAAFAIAVGLALWRWQTRRMHRSATPTTSTKLKAKADFLARAGRSYGYANSKKGFIDDWRLSEFPTLIPPLRLQSKDQGDGNRSEQSEPEVYLDFAGSAIPTRTLLSRICSEEQVLANPHSQGGGLASDRTLTLMQLAKDRAMQHFGIRHEAFGLEELDKEGDDEITCPGFQLVFTSGATESLRLVAERFPWSIARISCNEPSRMFTRREQMDSPAQLKSMQAQSILLHPRNVHTSVIGMREVAMQRGAGFRCVPVDQLLSATSEWFQSLINASMRCCEYGNMKAHNAVQTKEEKKDDCIAVGCGEAEPTTGKTIWMHHLIVLPLECNFGGDRFDWSKTVAAARESCFSTCIDCCGEDGQRAASIRIIHKWHILLDTAKAGATSPVDLPTLTEGGPDFAVASFYKMFGAPTGLGVLFVKKNRRRTREAPPLPEPTDTSHLPNHCISETLVGGTVLLERSPAHRQYFGGGSVDVVLPDKDFVVARNGNPTRPPTNGRMGNKSSDEDESIDLGVMVHGTEHFRGIASLLHGFQEIDELGGMQAVASHAGCLAAELVRRLKKLTHDNGKPVAELYGQWRSFASEDTDILPGPTVAFNIRDRDGALIGYDEVLRLASLNCPPIQLRAGCFCNPGACQDALPLTDAEVLENYASGHVCGDRRGIVNGKPTGAIRASFGKDSIWEDMDALASFVDKVFVSREEETLMQYTSSGRRASQDTMKIDRLYVFPIKSCAAMRVTRWPVDRRTGRLAFDREFALVDTSGSAMRLHSHPKMSEIHSSIDLNAQTLTVTAPNHEVLTIDLEEPASGSRPVSPENIQVCGVLCKGNIWGCSKAARWFSSVLGVRCWLARHYDAGETETLTDGDDRPAYCNEASLLLVSQQSISFLNSVITAQGWGRLVEARHFRPNIVVASDCTGEQDAEEQGVANLEDAWQRITISGSTDAVELKAVGKCARCQMVDIDPTSGMKGNTLRALAQYRRDRGRINFGTFFAGRTDAPEGAAWLEEGSDVCAELIPDE